MYQLPVSRLGSASWRISYCSQVSVFALLREMGSEWCLKGGRELRKLHRECYIQCLFLFPLYSGYATSLHHRNKYLWVQVIQLWCQESCESPKMGVVLETPAHKCLVIDAICNNSEAVRFGGMGPKLRKNLCHLLTSSYLGDIGWEVACFLCSSGEFHVQEIDEPRTKPHFALSGAKQRLNDSF
jgi:hypothetical protein